MVWFLGEALRVLCFVGGAMVGALIMLSPFVLLIAFDLGKREWRLRRVSQTIKLWLVDRLMRRAKRRWLMEDHDGYVVNGPDGDFWHLCITVLLAFAGHALYSAAHPYNWFESVVVYQSAAVGGALLCMIIVFLEGVVLLMLLYTLIFFSTKLMLRFMWRGLTGEWRVRPDTVKRGLVRLASAIHRSPEGAGEIVVNRLKERFRLAHCIAQALGVKPESDKIRDYVFLRIV